MYTIFLCAVALLLAYCYARFWSSAILKHHTLKLNNNIFYHKENGNFCVEISQ